MQDTQKLAYQRTQFLNQNAVAVSQLLDFELLEESLSSKDSSSPSIDSLRAEISRIRADLQLPAEVSVLKVEGQAGRILVSSDESEKRGDPVFLGSHLWETLYAHLPASEGLEGKKANYYIRSSSPIFNPEGQLIALLHLKANANELFTQMASFSLYYLTMFLAMAALGIFGALLVSSRKRSDLQIVQERNDYLSEETPEAILVLDSEFKIIRLNPAACFELQQVEQDLLGSFFLGEGSELALSPLDQQLSELPAQMRKEKQTRFKAKYLSTKDEVKFYEVKVFTHRRHKQAVEYTVVMNDLTKKSGKVTESLPFQSNLNLQDTDFLDVLTGLPNKEFLDNLFKDHGSLLRAQNSSILYLDLDDFQYFEHLHGRQQADALVQEFAKLLQAFFRQSDQIIHLERDRFVVILSQTDLRTSAQLAKNLGQEIQKQASQALRQTLFSVGLAQMKESEFAKNCFERAQKALIRAKQSGKAGIEIDA